RAPRVGGTDLRAGQWHGGRASLVGSTDRARCARIVGWLIALGAWRGGAAGVVGGAWSGWWFVCTLASLVDRACARGSFRWRRGLWGGVGLRLRGCLPWRRGRGGGVLAGCGRRVFCRGGGRRSGRSRV